MRLRERLRTARAQLAEPLTARLYQPRTAADLPLSLFYVGRASAARDFETYVKGGNEGEAPAADELYRGGPMGLFLSARRLQRSGEADIVARELGPMSRAGAGELLHFPYLEGTLELAGSVEEQIERVRSKAHRRRLRRCLRQRSLRWTVSGDQESLTRFYRTLYEPFGRARFGPQWAMDSLEFMAALFRDRNGRVLLVARDGETVCGAMLYDESPGVLAYHRNGFSGRFQVDSPAYAELTAGLEISLLQYAFDSGAARINLGFTRALLCDGLFTHKRRLGCSFSILPGSPAFSMRFRRQLRAAILSRFPLLSATEGRFVAQLGYSRNQAPRTRRQWRSALRGYVFPGLSSVCAHTDARPPDPGRETWLTALRECVGSIPLTIEEI